MNTQDKIIQNKPGVIKLAKMLGNVSQADRVVCISRESFQRLSSCMKPVEKLHSGNQLRKALHQKLSRTID